MRMKNGFLFSLLRSLTMAYEVHIKVMLKKVMLITGKVKVVFLNNNFLYNKWKLCRNKERTNNVFHK